MSSGCRRRHKFNVWRPMQSESGASLGERVAYLEAAYEHTATIADVKELKGELRTLKWVLGLLLTPTVGAVIAAVVKLWV